MSDWMAFKAIFAPYGYLASERITQLRALSYLVNQKWFYRRWVVQEVAFAKEIIVQCGHSRASWPEFANTVAFLHKHYHKLVYILRTFYIQKGSVDWTLGMTLGETILTGYLTYKPKQPHNTFSSQAVFARVLETAYARVWWILARSLPNCGHCKCQIRVTRFLLSSLSRAIPRLRRLVSELQQIFIRIFFWTFSNT